MENTRIVILGGTSGIGLSAAQLFASEGWEVIVAGRNAEKIAAAEKHPSGKIHGEQVDAMSTENLTSFFRKIGPFDHLVLALSGHKAGGPFQNLQLQQLREAFDEKFWPQITAAQLCLDTIRPSGSITFLTATSSRNRMKGLIGSSAVNAALEGIVESLAIELAPVRVNAVAPGVIDTPWWDWLPPPTKPVILQKSAEGTLAGRLGTASEVAAAIQYLVGNSYVTGTTMDVDGGLRLKK